MRPILKSGLITLITLFCLNSYGQSYVDDAKNLVAFKKFYEQNQKKVKNESKDEIDLNSYEVQLRLAELVYNSINTVPDLNDSNQASNQESDDDWNLDENDQNAPDESDTSQDWSAFSMSANSFNNSIQNEFAGSSQDTVLEAANIKQIQKEIAFYVRFAKESLETQLNYKVDSLQTPAKLRHLAGTIEAINSDGSAEFTSGPGLSSVLGVSQAEILQGIAQWALERAEQELMQSFLREWVQKIEQDPILSATFPNTLKMLSTSDVSSIITDGSTWKATFLEDFDNIPTESPAIFEAVIKELNIDVSPKAQREISAGLNIVAGLSKDLSFNKPAEQILMEIGQLSLLNAKSYISKSQNNLVPLIDRVLVSTQLFMSVVENYDSDRLQFVNATKISSLNIEEVEALWNLIVLRNHETLDIAFNLNAQNAVAFYSEVKKKLQEFQIQLTTLVSSGERVLNLSKKVASRLDDASSSFTFDEFGEYVDSVFGIIEGAVGTMATIGDASPIIADIKSYTDTYLMGLKYVTSIQEGVSTKQYGVVVLNALNFILWLHDTIAKDNLSTQVDFTELLSSFNGVDLTQSEAVNAAFTVLETKLGEQLKEYPQTAALLKQKLEAVNTDLVSNTALTLVGVKNAIKEQFNFSESETRTVVTELASEKLQKLATSSESINKYGKLMATIILAKNSDDIKQALESVANQTGGYLLRQKSYFSTTVSFYPGAAAGFESTKVSGQESTSGAFASATLPIGVEWAMGTNWKPIGAVGLFVQVLDLGAVLNYSLNNDNDALNDNPEIGFKQVLSPGGYLTLHVANSPITIGLGAKYLPELRSISSDQSADLQANSLQIGAFLSVDLNVFTLSASDKKYALKSKSLKSTYNDESSKD